MSGAPKSLSRIRAFLRQTVELVADEAWEIEQGWAVRTPSLPVVWFLNHVHVEVPIGYREAVGLCERHLPGAGFQQLYLEHEPSARELTDESRQKGWEVDVEVQMELARGPDRRVDLSGVIEPDEAEALALMERWFAEDRTLDLTPAGMRQLVQSYHLTWQARGARRLGVRRPDGGLAGITVVFSDGALAQVEDVYVSAEDRGRGHGRTLVSAAVELARRRGHELIFIAADDNDWPKQLYGKLGFEPVGRTWLLHRSGPRSPS